MALSSVFVSLCLVAAAQAFPQRPQPDCSRACSWCEHAVHPVLREISHRCPGCACAAHNVTCPRPKPSTRFCLQGVAKDTRGCESDRCRATPRLPALRSMLQDCPKSCPGGYLVNATTGLPLCECICPLERLPAMQRTQQCAQRCRGFTFTTLFNPRSGCTECSCDKKLAVPNCQPFTCPLHCPLGYQLDPLGCPQCLCREPKHCPTAPKCEETCLVGPQRDPMSGCVTSCECSDETEQYCPFFGCNADCGPHTLENVFHKGCQVVIFSIFSFRYHFSTFNFFRLVANANANPYNVLQQKLAWTRSKTNTAAPHANANLSFKFPSSKHPRSPKLQPAKSAPCPVRQAFANSTSQRNANFANAAPTYGPLVLFSSATALQRTPSVVRCALVKHERRKKSRTSFQHGEPENRAASILTSSQNKTSPSLLQNQLNLKTPGHS